MNCPTFVDKATLWRGIATHLPDLQAHDTNALLRALLCRDWTVQFMLVTDKETSNTWFICLVHSEQQGGHWFEEADPEMALLMAVTMALEGK